MNDMLKIKEMCTTKNRKEGTIWKQVWTCTSTFNINLLDIPAKVKLGWLERGGKIDLQTQFKSKFKSAAEVVAFLSKHNNIIDRAALEDLGRVQPIPDASEMSEADQDRLMAQLLELRKARK